MRMSILLCALMVVRLVSAAAAPLSPDEIKKQNDFKKAYSSGDAHERTQALAQLDGAVHASTRELLSAVVALDQSSEVKDEALRRLVKMPVRDTSLGHSLATLFANLKPVDVDAHVIFAKIMWESEFKTELVEAMVEYGNKLRYPNLMTGYAGTNTNTTYGAANGTLGDPNVKIEKQRGEFERYLAEFNALTKAKVTASDKNAPAEFRKWWAENREKYISADRAILQKYHDEDVAQQKAEKAAHDAALKKITLIARTPLRSTAVRVDEFQ